MYATNASGSWAAETVDPTVVGDYTSIGLDSSGKAHISYWDWTNSDLKYATNASGDWAAETVDSAGDVGLYTSIGLDSSGMVHISYWDRTEDNLKYATNASGSWVAIAVDSGEAGTLYPYSPVSAASSIGWTVPSSPEASAMDMRSGNASTSNPFNSIALLLIPIGAVLILRVRLRK
jgi:hypothetical protein